MELEKLLEKVERLVEEENTPEEKETEQPQENNNPEAAQDNNQNSDESSQEGQNQESTETKQPPEILKEFEGKTKVSPNDVKAVLADSTKAQQLIDWVKTQNPVVKEVQGLQSFVKQLQMNKITDNNAQTQSNSQQTSQNQTQSNGQQANQTQEAKPQRAYNEYFEPLGKLMKTQADVNKAIEYFTNLKNTKPAN